VAGRHARQVERLKLTTSLSAPIPLQMALADYLAQGGYDRHLRQLRLTLAAQQHTMLQAIAVHFPPGTRVTRPQGGYFVWVEMPVGVDALALHRSAWRPASASRPAPSFRPRAHFATASASITATRGARRWRRPSPRWGGWLWRRWLSREKIPAANKCFIPKRNITVILVYL
jgi:DNA-binding transcriptional MocR family regulator